MWLLNVKYGKDIAELGYAMSQHAVLKYVVDFQVRISCVLSNIHLLSVL